MFDAKEIINVPSSIPRIHFRHITIATPDDKSASLIFSDKLAVELHTQNGEIKGVGHRLEPVAEIVCDVRQLCYLKDIIEARLSEIGFVPLEEV